MSPIQTADQWLVPDTMLIMVCRGMTCGDFNELWLSLVAMLASALFQIGTVCNSGIRDAYVGKTMSSTYLPSPWPCSTRARSRTTCIGKKTVFFAFFQFDKQFWQANTLWPYTWRCSSSGGRWAYHRCCLGSHHPPAALGPLQTLTVYSHGASRSHKVSDFWFVHSQLERLEVLCEEHKVLQCFCCTDAFGVQKRKQYVCKDGTIRLTRQTRSTQIHYSNAFYKALFLLETNQHWGTIYIFSGLAISTTEDGKGSLGLRSPFSSNSLLLAALFNCGCLSLSTTTGNCHLTHIVIDVMTVIVHLGFLQVRPGIEGGVQLWLHITPAGLSVPPDPCLIWASRQASVNIHVTYIRDVLR